MTARAVLRCLATFAVGALTGLPLLAFFIGA